MIMNANQIFKEWESGKWRPLHLIVGEEPFQVDEILAHIARLNGLEATTERIRSKRVGDSIVGTGLRQKPQNGRPELYEGAVVVQR